jgi:hypothetical protein
LGFHSTHQNLVAVSVRKRIQSEFDTKLMLLQENSTRQQKSGFPDSKKNSVKTPEMSGNLWDQG